MTNHFLLKSLQALQQTRWTIHQMVQGTGPPVHLGTSPEVPSQWLGMGQESPILDPETNLEGPISCGAYYTYRSKGDRDLPLDPLHSLKGDYRRRWEMACLSLRSPNLSKIRLTGIPWSSLLCFGFFSSPNDLSTVPIDLRSLWLALQHVWVDLIPCPGLLANLWFWGDSIIPCINMHLLFDSCP